MRSTADQRLKTLGDPRVFLVMLLIKIQLLTFDRIEARPSVSGMHALAKLVFDGRGFQFELSIVAALPGQPVRRPPRVRALNGIGTERKRRTARSVEVGKFLRVERAGG